MEDFEYSVEISDRDWDCFVQECEECTLLPPMLAGLDDSALSDLDELGSALSARGLKPQMTPPDLGEAFPVAEQHIDGLPDSKGSPVQNYLSKYAVGGSESLSCSEEDRHLESINRFLERLRSLPETDQLTKPSQTAMGNTAGEALGKEAVFSDGLQANIAALPINILQLNSQLAVSETAAGGERTAPDNSISSASDKDGAWSNMLPERAAHGSHGETDKSSFLNTELVIREEEGSVTSAREDGRSRESRHKMELTVRPDRSPAPEMALSSEVCATISVDDHGLRDDSADQAAPQKSPHLDKKSPINPDVIQHDNVAEESKYMSVGSPYGDLGQRGVTKATSQELESPSSNRKKRRKKKRASVELLTNQSDSEEGPRALWVTETNPQTRLSRDRGAVLLNETHHEHSRPPGHQTMENVSPTSPSYSDIVKRASSNFPCRKTAVVNVEAGLHAPLTPSLCEFQKLKVYEECDLTEVTVLEKLLAANAGCVPREPNLLLSSKDTDGSNPLPCRADDTDLSTPSGSGGGGDAAVNLQSCSAPTSQASIELEESDRLSVWCATCVGGESVKTGSLAPGQKEAEPQEQERNRYCTNMEAAYKGCIAADFTASTKHDTSVAVEAPDSLIGLNTKRPFLVEEIHGELERTSSDFREMRKEDVGTDITLECITLPIPNKCNQPHFSELETINRKTQDQDQSIVDVTVFPGSRFNSPSSEEMCHSKMSDRISVFKENHKSCDTSTVPSVTTITEMEMTSMSPERRCKGENQIPCGLENETTPPITVKTEVTKKHEGQDISEEILKLRSESDVSPEDARGMTVENEVAEKSPDSKMSVYAMSSFWKDMEQLTIKDILRLRKVGGLQPSSIPPVSGMVEFPEALESRYFAQQSGSKRVESSGNLSNVSDSAEDSDAMSDPFAGDGSVNLWGSDPDPPTLGADKHLDQSDLPKDIPQQLIPGSPQKYYVKKMYRNRSVKNLPVLESEPLGQLPKCQVLPTVIAEEGESDMELLGEAPTQDSGLDSLPSAFTSKQVKTQSFSASLTNIFGHLFSRRTSEPRQSDTDNIAAHCVSGNTVPETYDHFFSEFDVGSFFYPLIEEGRSKDETVPIFSCSRSANRNFQYPDAYDHFFSSSSSSDDSDEEFSEDRAPIRVVSRFVHQDREIQRTSTGPDIYENFFPDWDLGENFFWKNGLSLRNFRFSSSTIPTQTLDSRALVTVNQNRKFAQRTIQPINALGYHEQAFPDPLLFNLEERIARQLAQKPWKCDDMQIAVANPRLDEPLGPLRQADMCLVCIAFASWVLKTADPQVGDAWKAVLLANVSALSAIGYLRRRVRHKEADHEEKLRRTPSV